MNSTSSFSSIEVSHNLIIGQLAQIVSQIIPGNISTAADGLSFVLNRDKSKDKKGIVSFQAKVRDDDIISLQIELLRSDRNVRISASPLFSHLASLGQRVHFIPPPQNSSKGQNSLWVELHVQAAPLSYSRSAKLAEEITNINKLAKTLQNALPESQTPADLMKKYKNTADVLEPVFPVALFQGILDNSIKAWLAETYDFLNGSLNVALASPFHVSVAISLALLADMSMSYGSSIGKLILPAVNSKMLLDIINKAPGTVTVPAICIKVGSNIYEMGGEAQTLLTMLSENDSPAIFYGQYEQMQSVFGGGQGGVNDPTLPVVRHVPDFPLEILARYSVEYQSQKHSGLAQSAKDQIIKCALEQLEAYPHATQRNLLPSFIARQMKAEFIGQKSLSPSTVFLSSINNLSETMGGLSHKRKTGRLPQVQERFTEVLTDPTLFKFFSSEIFAQDKALREFCDRLSMESLTRSVYQPIRLCSQGTPGTGKSKSAQMLADKLDIPIVNIDAASIPDFYTASAQLLGSGRGIVGSHQSGRLEQAAKNSSGCILECSDLDHASPQVRQALADLFLQVLETGEAQSAAGSMFSCANIIFIFTINLPDGLDEAIRKGFGFENIPSDSEIRRSVDTHIKQMFSGAFLSRIGSPILFDILSGDTLAIIVERTILESLQLSFQRVNMKEREISLADGLGKKVLSGMNKNITSYGARIIIDETRARSARAFLNFKNSKSGTKAGSVQISMDRNGRLVLK